MTDQELIRNILTILYVEDGKVNPDKEWKVDTIEHVAEAIKDAGYDPEITLAINPADKISSGWGIDDVKGCLEEKHPGMSDNTARYILGLLDNNFDASVGINWNVIADTMWNDLWEFQYEAGYLDKKKTKLRMSDAEASKLLETLTATHEDTPQGIDREQKLELARAWRKAWLKAWRKERPKKK